MRSRNQSSTYARDQRLPTLPRVKHVTALLLLAGLLAGCAGEGPSSSSPAAAPTAPPPPGVSVSLGQWRSDEPVHRMQVAVRNTTDTPVHFVDAQLITASFASLAPEKVDITVKKTERTDLPIPYGKANCLPDRLPEVQPATVVAHVRVGDDTQVRRVAFELPHPDPLLSRLLRDECSEHLIKVAADITFGPEWKRVGDAMHGTLTLTRRGRGAVTVHRIDGTTHYIAAPVEPADPLVVLAADAQQAEVAVKLTPRR